MMDDQNNKTIVIGQQKDAYRMPLNLIQMARYLAYFSMNATRDLNTIFGMLDLDASSRKRLGNTIEFKTGENTRSSLRAINKGLTMELYASGMFAYIDSPSEVHANCLVSYCQSNHTNGKTQIAVPSNFAQGNRPDVEIDYRDFMLILEVSAKYQPPLEHYQSQLSGALKHARSIREKGYNKPIYCLLINECTLLNVDNMQALKQCQETIKPSEEIAMLSISINEFAELGQMIGDQYEEEIAKLDSHDLHNLLKKTVSKGVHGHFHQLLMEHLAAQKSASAESTGRFSW